MTIAGDAGVGKTRVLRELRGWLAELDPEPLQRTGRCLPYGRAAYGPLGDVLKEQLGVREDEPAASVRDRLGDREILGIALGIDVAHGLHPLVTRDRFQDAWVELLTELTAERPVAILVEDLHWADESLLELVEHLLEHVRGPMIVLATARPEILDTHQGVGRRAGRTLSLDPLTVPPAVSWSSSCSGRARRRRCGTCSPRGEGNPFFLEEVLASLIDEGLLARADGVVDAA